MANKEQTTFENPYFGYTENAANTLKEMWNLQMKNTQNFFDQGVRAAQTWADFAQTQVQESARFSQELVKMGMQNTEEVKKTMTSLNEKIFSHPTK